MMYITVVGVENVYQGDTVSYIMTEMLVRCCNEQSGENESRSLLVSAPSHAEKNQEQPLEPG